MYNHSHTIQVVIISVTKPLSYDDSLVHPKHKCIEKFAKKLDKNQTIKILNPLFFNLPETLNPFRCQMDLRLSCSWLFPHFLSQTPGRYPHARRSANLLYNTVPCYGKQTCGPSLPQHQLKQNKTGQVMVFSQNLLAAWRFLSTGSCGKNKACTVNSRDSSTKEDIKEAIQYSTISQRMPS